MGFNWIKRLENHRGSRHILFWVSWVLGFTLVKSIGQPFEIYLGWFCYYMITLPLFMCHTYLVAYLLFPMLGKRSQYLFFTLAFIFLLVFFSIAELILSYEFIFIWFPTGLEPLDEYFSAGVILANGLGNLYIVLMFLALRTIRNWYRADRERKELQHVSLQLELKDALTKFQPDMLLYAIEQIDRVVTDAPEKTTEAIAMTSALLSDIMNYRDKHFNLFGGEISLVHKLSRLVSTFRNERIELEFLISGDPSDIRLPSMLFFTVIDMIIRLYADKEFFPEIAVEVSSYSNMISIQIMTGEDSKGNDDYKACMNLIKQVRHSYGSMVTINIETLSYGCTLSLAGKKPQA